MTLSRIQRRFRLFAGVVPLAAVVLGVLMCSPDSAPARNEDVKTGPRVMRVRPPGDRGPSTQPSAPPTDGFSAAIGEPDRDDVLKFFSTHTPKRFQTFDNLKDRPGGRQLLHRMTERYRRLMRLQADDPELYAIAVKQMELQDDVFSTVRSHQRERSRDREPDAQSVEQLRSRVRELVDLSLQERQRRVERLEKMLQDQRARLDEDKKNPEALVDKHLEQMSRDAEEFLRLRAPTTRPR